MNNANNQLTIASASALGAEYTGPGEMPQSFVVAACKSEIDTAALLGAFQDAKHAANFDRATAELAETGMFDDMPSVIAYRAALGN